MSTNRQILRGFSLGIIGLMVIVSFPMGQFFSPAANASVSTQLITASSNEGLIDSVLADTTTSSSQRGIIVNLSDEFAVIQAIAFSKSYDSKIYSLTDTGLLAKLSNDAITDVTVIGNSGDFTSTMLSTLSSAVNLEFTVVSDSILERSLALNDADLSSNNVYGWYFANDQVTKYKRIYIEDVHL